MVRAVVDAHKHIHTQVHREDTRHVDIAVTENWTREPFFQCQLNYTQTNVALHTYTLHARSLFLINMFTNYESFVSHARAFCVPKQRTWRSNRMEIKLKKTHGLFTVKKIEQK